MKTSQRDNAYHHIRHKVLVGDFVTGQRLYPELLAKEIGISQVPVREAIGQLQSEGLIVHKPHRGIFVKRIERQDLVDMIEFRTVLECAAAAQAAKRVSVAQLRELDERWAEMCRLANAFDVPPGTNLTNLKKMLQAWTLADLAFHMVLLRAAGNRRAIRALEDAHVTLRMFGYRVDIPSVWSDPAAWAAENLQVHQEIYDAVRRHDIKAARRAMAVHMRRAGKNILARFDWIQRQRDADRELTEDYPESVRDTVRDIQRRDQLRMSPRSEKPDGHHGGEEN